LLSSCASRLPPIAEPAATAPLSRFADAIAGFYQFSSGIDAEQHMVIRNQQDWEQLWARLTARLGDRPPAPKVNFSSELVLIAAMGNRPSGGYAVKIERVVAHPIGHEVLVRHTSPGPRCGTTQAITSPVDIVRVAASPKPVRWRFVRDVMDCG
jgi:hypothetical protein